ncbi:transposase [Actinoplanes sp. TBRC 11911]|uniref:transposase n=1 Tax=Actinoplanes sp. TBRC 11911 TaxID=2729386 RepID=UPI00145F106B|nr:transposase [Actinoplanes sp. TBRC 11911]
MRDDRWGVVAGDLTDQEWERLEPLLPSMAPQRGGRWREHRQVINITLWRVDDGAKRDQVPERCGPAKPATTGSPAGNRTAPAHGSRNSWRPTRM